jgi:hypothetical protein
MKRALFWRVLVRGDRRYRERPPWLRPEDYAIRDEALRLVAGETE